MTEQPVTRAAAGAMMAEIASAFRSGSDRTTIHLLNVDFVVEKQSTGVLVVQYVGHPAGHFYEAAAAPPHAFPTHMPFVPGETVMATESTRGDWSLVWWAPRDPEVVFTHLRQDTESAGWARTESPNPADDRVVRLCYLKDGVVRHILKTDEAVTLTQRPVR